MHKQQLPIIGLASPRKPFVESLNACRSKFLRSRFGPCFEWLIYASRRVVVSTLWKNWPNQAACCFSSSWMGSLIAGMVERWMSTNCRQFLHLWKIFDKNLTSYHYYFGLFSRCLMPPMLGYELILLSKYAILLRADQIGLIQLDSSPPFLDIFLSTV